MPHDPNLQEQWFQLVGNYDIRRLLYHLKTHECSTLKDIQPVCASSSQRTTALSLLQQQGLIRFHKETGIWHRQDTAWQGKTLGATLEWHVREIMQRQLHGLARHGVQVASMKTQGDLDVLAFLPRQLPRSTPRSKHGPSHWLVAIACKSSTDIAPDRFPLILRRFQELKADLSVLFVDTRDTTTMYRAFQTAVNTSINKRLHPRSCPGVFSLTRWSGDTPRIIALLTAEVSLTISLPSIINYLNAWQEI